jgi:hypothetical protein
MKFTALVLASSLYSSSAFTAPSVNVKSTALFSEEAAEVPEAPAGYGKTDLESLATDLNPLVNYYDPLNLAEAEFWDDTNEATIGFLRHAEIKHGRVAMAAFVGYCIQSNFHWPWKMTTAGDEFPSIDLSPEQQWDAIPEVAKWQIVLVVGFLEAWGEFPDPSNQHYMRGGKPGVYPTFDNFRSMVHPVPFNLYDPFNLSKKRSAEKKERGLKVEINNGRLAMLGIFGFLSADKIPGSVPLLNDIAIPYDGNVMATFAADRHIFG